jgi:hypothetical protein
MAGCARLPPYWDGSLKYFQKSAEDGFETAYGHYGTILYLEKSEIEEAEKWFVKADEAGCLDALQAYNQCRFL